MRSLSCLGEQAVKRTRIGQRYRNIARHYTTGRDRLKGFRGACSLRIPISRICKFSIRFFSRQRENTSPHNFGFSSVLLVESQTAKANCSPNRRMDAMKTLGPVILLFALLLSTFAQADAQDSVITFYTTDTARRDGASIVYSNGQKIGEAIK